MIALQHYQGRDLQEIAVEAFVAGKMLPVYKAGGDLVSEYNKLQISWQHEICPTVWQGLHTLLENRLVGKFGFKLPNFTFEELEELCYDYQQVGNLVEAYVSSHAQSGVSVKNLKDAICEIFFGEKFLGSISNRTRDVLEELVALYELIEKINAVFCIQFKGNAYFNEVHVLLINMNTNSLYGLANISKEKVSTFFFVSSLLSASRLKNLRKNASRNNTVAKLVRGRLFDLGRDTEVEENFFAIAEYILQDYPQGSATFRSTSRPSDEEFQAVDGYKIYRLVDNLIELYTASFLEAFSGEKENTGEELQKCA